MRVESLNRSGVETVCFADGGEIRSGICKRPQQGPVRVGPEGLTGDEVHDRRFHGGPNRALHAFALEGYRALEEASGAALPVPCFGENLTVGGLTEVDVRPGDVWQVGSARLQVTMPTERCAHPGRLAGHPRILSWVVRDGRCGWYLRVLEPGLLETGDAIARAERGPEGPTLLDLHIWMRDQAGDPDILRQIEAHPALAPEWKERMRILHARRRKP